MLCSHYYPLSVEMERAPATAIYLSSYQYPFILSNPKPISNIEVPSPTTTLIIDLFVK